MYSINVKKERWFLVLMLVLFVGQIPLYPYLPVQLPMHWNIDGIVDRTMPKTPLTILLFPGIIAFTYLVMLFVPYIDPRRERYAQFMREYNLFRYFVVIFVAIVYGITVLYALGFPVPVGKSVSFLIALLFVFLGNYMGKIKRNWFVGLRFPWTMENEEVWNRTHRFGGKLMVCAGIVAILGLVFKAMVSFVLLIGSIFLSILITATYSYFIYKKTYKPVDRT